MSASGAPCPLLADENVPPLGLVLFRDAPETPTSTGEFLEALLSREDLELVGRTRS